MSDKDVKLAKVQINGKALEVDPKLSIFQAATQNGIEIPHYCYHQDLSVAGVCRMCMVEIEKNPRLQISCNTQVADGMVIRTDTDKVKETVKSTLELHLINHPVDCPICDKAGECKLQDYYADYGLYASRVTLEDKVHKPKVVDIGTIMLDEERCILCSRCVRFTAEVTKTHELGIFNRGDRSELRTYDNGPLRNDYTGNLADICPVGALTAKDFRFRCRVWFLEKTSSVCAQCAHGCNTQVSVNPAVKKLHRVEPRRNPDVNKSWICDLGRWDFHYVSSDNRIKVAEKNGDGIRNEISWHEGFQTLSAEDKSKWCVALSSQLTNEEILYSVKSLSKAGVKNFTWIVDEKVVDEKAPFDGILKHHDETPNAQGLQEMMKLLRVNFMRREEAVKKITSEKLERVLVVGMEGEKMAGLPEFLLAVPKGVKVALHASHRAAMFERCDFVFPNATCFEKNGTYISALGRLQKVNAALPLQFTSRDAFGLVFGIERGSDRDVLPTKVREDIFASELSGKCGGVKWTKFPKMGLVWQA